jgi:NAD(P)-dependent dehydrogenase (short-subunit alcohol dehydrogenase family)
MQDKRVALVTGANKGIGQQIAKDLAARGLTVVLGARDLAQGKEAAAAVGGDARAVQLDVTDAASIAAAAGWIRAELGRLDVLVNNAGVAHAGAPDRPLMEVVLSGRPSVASLAEVRAVFETNVFGALAVSQAMLPLLREAPAGRIVNVASVAGSLTLAADPKNPYRGMFNAVYSPSKVALNAMTLALAIELDGTKIKVNSMCPGFTKTALNNFEGTRSVEEGARRAVELALLGDDGPTGTFSNEDGPLPW